MIKNPLATAIHYLEFLVLVLKKLRKKILKMRIKEKFTVAIIFALFLGLFFFLGMSFAVLLVGFDVDNCPRCNSDVRFTDADGNTLVAECTEYSVQTNNNERPFFIWYKSKRMESNSW